ncbi:hypothetical protein H0H92_009915 [Tricholoma furcatifolium]|nr:hypothetical protein H0H92_009915 [Tricholoma furcatifolium]
MSIFNKAKNVEVNDSTISTVSGNQNIAENMTIYQSQKKLKGGGQPSSEEFSELITDDVGTMNANARPAIVRPHLRKARLKEDSAVTSSSASNDPIYNVGRDAYIAGSIHNNFQDSGE